MRIVHRSRAVLIALALCCAAAPAVAQAQPPTAPSEKPGDTSAPKGPEEEAVTKAREHFNRGVELFREANFQAALIEFRRANEVSPNYRILFNLGQTYAELQDYAGAMTTFATYLQLGGTEIDASRRTEVEQELAKLRTRVASATITTNVAGAEILVDDAVVGQSPLSGPVLVSAGRRRLAVNTGRGLPTVKYVELAGGDSIEVQLLVETPADKPDPAPAAAQAGAPPMSDRAANRGMGTGFWVSLVATGVFATGATVTGILASNSKSDYDRELDTYPTTAGAVDDARNKTDRLALTTDILGGAAIVSGTLAIVFAATRPSAPASPPAAQAPAPRMRVGLGASSLVLDGRF